MTFPSWLSHARFSRLAHQSRAAVWGPAPGAARAEASRAAPVLRVDPAPPAQRSHEPRREPGADNHEQRAYFHSQALLFVFPSASALYSKTTATAFKRRKFGESL